MSADDGLKAARYRLTGIYGLAHFGKSLFWNTSALIFAFFLTETVGMSPQIMGYVLAASLFFNACLDYTIGRVLSAHVRSAASSARAQFFGGLVAAGAFVAFAASGFVPQEAQTAYAMITIFVFRLGYSLYDVPQNAFMAFAASDDRERATLASIRYIAAGASILVIALIFAPIIRETDPDRQASSFVQIALGLSLTSIVCSGGLLWQSGRPYGPTIIKSESPRPAPAVPGPKIYPLLLAGIAIISLTLPVFAKLEAYFTAYVLDKPLSAFLFMGCVAGGKVAAQPMWVWVSHRTSLALAFRMASLSWGGGGHHLLQLRPDRAMGHAPISPSLWGSLRRCPDEPLGPARPRCVA